jgi:hypothetical protein
MVNVLLESYNLTEPFLYDVLKPYIKPHHRVAIVAFSFLPSQATTLEQWLTMYGREEGMFYHWLIDPLMEFGIPEENITVVNYFADSKELAREKVENADILYFTGGLPDAMMDRLAEFELLDVLQSFDGLVLGCSAGAMIQLQEYHITPDWDYPEFGYYNGLPWLNDFYIEVHYEETQLQKDCIQRVLRERGKPVYAIHHDKGALIVEKGIITRLGETELFLP